MEPGRGGETPSGNRPHPNRGLQAGDKPKIEVFRAAAGHAGCSVSRMNWWRYQRRAVRNGVPVFGLDDAVGVARLIAQKFLGGIICCKTCIAGNRIITISVTDKCNLRCVYCMPETGWNPSSTRKSCALRRFCGWCVALWVGLEESPPDGGEPLVRRGIVDFVAQ